MVTDAQVRRLMSLIPKEKTLAVAAAKTGMDEKTARKYRRSGRLPSSMKAEHTWRTRPGPVHRGLAGGSRTSGSEPRAGSQDAVHPSPADLSGPLPGRPAPDTAAQGQDLAWTGGTLSRSVLPAGAQARRSQSVRLHRLRSDVEPLPPPGWASAEWILEVPQRLQLVSGID